MSQIIFLQKLSYSSFRFIVFLEKEIVKLKVTDSFVHFKTQIKYRLKYSRGGQH